ncbi:MAG: twin-arginine translocase TatA/TatE family subunit [Bacteroidales bacterium]|nr:twin-arginine translocase TatA/TatE family subunit [Bacteroidales bacterium]
MELFVLLAMPGIWSMALIVIAILLLFGGKKIPEMMKGLGSGVKEFKKGISDDDDEDSKTKKDKE